MHKHRSPPLYTIHFHVIHTNYYPPRGSGVLICTPYTSTSYKHTNYYPPRGSGVLICTPYQCSLSSAISRVCTHSEASCRKTNSPTRLCCCYQAKHSKLTEEIRDYRKRRRTYLLIEMFEKRMKSSLFYFIYPANNNSREKSGILARFPCFLLIFNLVFCL